jgi:hypothetical protein
VSPVVAGAATARQPPRADTRDVHLPNTVTSANHQPGGELVSDGVHHCTKARRPTTMYKVHVRGIVGSCIAAVQRLPLSLLHAARGTTNGTPSASPSVVQRPTRRDASSPCVLEQHAIELNRSNRYHFWSPQSFSWQSYLALSSVPYLVGMGSDVPVSEARSHRKLRTPALVKTPVAWV